jgi:hypothetical protein
VIPQDSREQQRLEEQLGFTARFLDIGDDPHGEKVHDLGPKKFSERALVTPEEFWERKQQRLREAIEQKQAYIASCRRALTGHRKELKRIEGEYAAAFRASRQMSSAEALADPVRRRALDAAVAGWDIPLGTARVNVGGTECLIRDAEDAIVEWEQRLKFAAKHKPITRDDLFAIARELSPPPEPTVAVGSAPLSPIDVARHLDDIERQLAEVRERQLTDEAKR